MRSFMDKTYAMLEGVLLSYNGRDAVLNVPDHFAGMPVNAIGHGTFMDSVVLRQVSVPKSIRKIGDRAFSGCRGLVSVTVPGTLEEVGRGIFSGCDRLTSLTFYDLPLSAESYQKLKDSSIPAAENIWIAREMPEIPLVRDIISGSPLAVPARFIPVGIERLFMAKNIAETIGAASLSANFDRFEFAGRSGALSEEETLPFLPASAAGFVTDPISEQKNDEFIRLEKYFPLSRTSVFTFDDSRTKTTFTGRTIYAGIKVGYFFWQSLLPLRADNRQYYIYRRNYLTTDSRFRYVRQDTAVFSDRGLIRDREEAQRVYAKYKLLTIL